MRISAAVVHEAGGRFCIEDVDLDDPRAGEVVVRVAAAGLCHTDLVTRAGALPPPLPAVLATKAPGSWSGSGPG